jgi:hypothetical protein
MAIVTNGIISLFCFYAFFQLKDFTDEANYYWKRFFIIFGISTFFGLLGHALFQYFDIPGKIPSWTLGCLSNVMAALGMLHFKGYSRIRKSAVPIVWLKSGILLVLSLVFMKFVFVAVDAILTYIVYTGLYAYELKKRGIPELKWMVIGVLIMFPSAFIFLMKINVHRWLNKDDLSHLLMLTGIVFFFRSMKKWGINSEMKLQHG